MKGKRLEILRVREASGEKANTPERVASLMADEALADRECMWVLHCTARLTLIEKELVSMGGLDTTYADLRTLFRKAVINCTNQIIVVHNHPSGNPAPSLADLRVAEQIEKAGKILGIEMVDFMIITPCGKYWSYRREYGSIDIKKAIEERTQQAHERAESTPQGTQQTLFETPSEYTIPDGNGHSPFLIEGANYTEFPYVAPCKPCRGYTELINTTVLPVEGRNLVSWGRIHPIYQDCGLPF